MVEHEHQSGEEHDIPLSSEAQRATSSNFIAYGILMETSLVPLAWIIGLLSGLWTLEELVAGSHLLLSPAHLGLGVLATLPMLVLLVIVLRASGPAFVRMRAFLEETLAPAIRESSLVALLGLSLAAGMGEEWLFRGVLQSGLLDWWESAPVPLVILVVAIAFGVCHWITHLYFLLATITGIYLGWLYWATGSLVEPILAHVLYDFIALLVIARQRTEPLRHRNPGEVEEMDKAGGQPE